jgi:peroxiredoxin
MLAAGDKAPQVTGASYDGMRFDLGAPGRRPVLFLYPRANTGG